MTSKEPGEVFREAWIAGVSAHYPGEPKPGYITPWADTPDWERAAAAAVEAQVAQLASLAPSGAAELSREQRGRFVALCWVAQIHENVANPKASYVADWDSLPEWQRKTDADIFDAVAGARP